ncbi:MAG TPA: hypothetical protein VGX23_15955 [Actinocrinis sp.]|nr:hypothetical protein [Actinocrinis sp.]
MPPGNPPTARTAQYIGRHEIAVRVGHGAEGAGYSLLDVRGAGDAYEANDLAANTEAQMAWEADPDAAAFRTLWVNRLWNTCLIMQFHAKPNDAIWFLHHARPAGERYRRAET